MTKTRLTAAEKRQAAQHEENRQEGLTFKAMREELIAQIVIHSGSDIIINESFTAEVRSTVYRTLHTALMAKETYEDALKQVARELAEATRYLEEGHLYTSRPIQSEVNVAHATFYASRKAAIDVLRTFGLYCPELDGTVGAKARQDIIVVSVTQPIEDGPFFVMVNGERALMPGFVGDDADRIPAFTDEAIAWRSAKTLAGVNMMSIQ
jgi:hypothetical protein